MKIITVCNIIKNLVISWHENNISRLSAALSFYMIFSLAPIILICIFIAGLVFDQNIAREAILAQINQVVGTEPTLQIQMIIENKNQLITKNLISILALIFSASGIFIEIQNGLNTIWGIKAKPSRNMMNIIGHRFLSFLIVIGIACIFLSMLIFNAFLLVINTHLNGALGTVLFLSILNELIFFLITVLLLAMLYKILPDTFVQWSKAWIGAIITALFFTVGKFFIELYTSTTHIASIFGAAGSFIVILIWVYYSAQLFFIGAEITKLLATRQERRPSTTIH